MRAWRPSDSDANDDGSQGMRGQEEEGSKHAHASSRSKEKKRHNDEKRFKPY